MQNCQGEFSWFNADVCILSKEEVISMEIYKSSENAHNETLERRMQTRRVRED